MWRVVIDEIMSLYKPTIIFSLILIYQCDELWYKLCHYGGPRTYSVEIVKNLPMLSDITINP